MKVGIYVRVSTSDKGQDPELQLGPLRKYAIARGWDFLEYVDLGESGVKDRRPGLDRLMEDARKRRLDGILVWKLDRLGRSLKHLLTMFEEFHDLGNPVRLLYGEFGFRDTRRASHGKSHRSLRGIRA